MKKNLFVLGLAVAAFASCTNEEVVDGVSNRAIEFNQFVNNNTRAVTELATAGLKSYYVFGEQGTADGQYGTQLFNNELQTTLYYWASNAYYSFGAYADGDNGKIANATFDAATQKLTFPSYTPNDAKDLVAAVAKAQTGADVSTSAPAPVPLTFKHMLSQVKFTFQTKDGESTTIAIQNLKFNAVKTADGTYTAGTIAWTANGANADYTYTDIADIAVAPQTPGQPATVATESHLVIPQATTDKISVIFDAVVTLPGQEPVTKTGLTATLACPVDQQGKLVANTWLPGYRYNYVAEVNADQIINNLHPITFTVTVEDWKDAYTPNTPTAPAKPVAPSF